MEEGGGNMNKKAESKDVNGVRMVYRGRGRGGGIGHG